MPCVLTGYCICISVINESSSSIKLEFGLAVGYNHSLSCIWLGHRVDIQNQIGIYLHYLYPAIPGLVKPYSRQYAKSFKNRVKVHCLTKMPKPPPPPRPHSIPIKNANKKTHIKNLNEQLTVWKNLQECFNHHRKIPSEAASRSSSWREFQSWDTSTAEAISLVEINHRTSANDRLAVEIESPPLVTEGKTRIL